MNEQEEHEQIATIKEYLNCFIRIATHAVGDATYAYETVEYGEEWCEIYGELEHLCRVAEEAKLRLVWARAKAFEAFEELEREKLSGAMKNKAVEE